MESGPGRTCLALPSLAVFGGRDELGSGARIVQRASAEPRQTAIEQTVVGLIRRWSKTAVTKRYRLFVGLRHCSRSCSPFAVIQFCTNGPPRTRTVGGVGGDSEMAENQLHAKAGWNITSILWTWPKLS